MSVGGIVECALLVSNQIVWLVLLQPTGDLQLAVES